MYQILADRYSPPFDQHWSSSLSPSLNAISVTTIFLKYSLLGAASRPSIVPLNSDYLDQDGWHIWKGYTGLDSVSCCYGGYD